MSSIFRFLRMAGVAAALLASAFGAAAENAPKGDGGTIRLMTSPAGTMSLPPFVMKRFGLDTKYGFVPESVPYSNANAATAALQGGNAEMVVYDWLASARLKQGGVDIVGIAPFMTYVNSVLVPKDSPLQSIADLKGKRLGVHSRTSFDWMMMEAVAKQRDGFDLAATASIQEAAAPLLRGSIDQGQLDATQMWNSLAADMLASGRYRTLVTIRELTESMGVPTAPFLFYGMRADYAAAHPQNARAFAAAYREAVRILNTDDEIWEDRGREMSLSPEGIVLFRDQVRRDLLETFTPEMNEALSPTFDIILTAVGPETIGFSEMPADMLSLDYQ